MVKSTMPSFQPVWQTALRFLAIVFVIGAGLNHFRNADFYKRIVPPMFPAPAALVLISGICEIAGGAGLAIPSVRRVAAWGLIALLVAVFPANIYMAMHPEKFADLGLPRWTFYARLPVQGILIWWVYLVS
jgi:uncharacterized membrane protein